jgi:hypothetical protein
VKDPGQFRRSLNILCIAGRKYFFQRLTKNLWKVIIRKIVLMKSEDVLLYCLPLQIVNVFIKYPEVKELLV